MDEFINRIKSVKGETKGRESDLIWRFHIALKRKQKPEGKRKTEKLWIVSLWSSGADLRTQAVERSEENAQTESDSRAPFAQFSKNTYSRQLKRDHPPKE